MKPIEGRHALRHVGVRNHTGLDDRTLRKLAGRGELVQVWRGVFVSAAVWADLGFEDRRRLTILAASDRAARRQVISHRSAALLLGVPFTGAQAVPVDVLAGVSAGSRTEHGFAKHATRTLDLEVVDVDGLRITSVARTVVELAMTLPFRDAIAAADWALQQGVPRELLLALLDELARGAALSVGSASFASPTAAPARPASRRAAPSSTSSASPRRTCRRSSPTASVSSASSTSSGRTSA